MLNFKILLIINSLALLHTSCTPALISDQDQLGHSKLETFEDGYNWAYNNQIENESDCYYLGFGAQNGCISYVDDY